ncbi:MAG: tRNA lysidine(34) synthetase TilS [Ruminococcaceae bacterium]|nr:tRNA lysidine(34) synthetase TilS [Oscillospiraceae bacterium]
MKVQANPALEAKKAIEKYNMLDNTSGIVLGLSGGADSVALFHILKNICKEKNIKLFAAHINHMLRDEAAFSDEEFVKKLCAQENIKLFVLRKDISLLAEQTNQGIEECARNVRYEFFNKILADTNSQKIAVAHNSDDCAETLLFNLTRGAGLKGLRGILPVRDNIIRPLLFVKKEDILNYCNKNNFSFVQDMSNFSLDYTRNKLRHNVLPALCDINPEVVSSFSKTASSLSEDYDFIQNTVEEQFNRCYSDSAIDLNIIRSLHPSIAKRCLQKAVFVCSNIEINSKTISNLYNLMKFGETSKKVQISGDFYAIINYGKLLFKHLEESAEEKFEIPVKEGQNILPCGKVFNITKNVNNLEIKNSIDCDKLIGNLKIVNRPICNQGAKSQRFYAYNACGSKSIKKLLIDKKIPAFQRNSLIFLKDDEGIVYIEKIGVAKRVAPSSNSVNIICVKI